MGLFKQHGTTQRLLREHFEAGSSGPCFPRRKEPYDGPLWCEPKVARDQHAQAKALYFLPARFVCKTLRPGLTAPRPAFAVAPCW